MGETGEAYVVMADFGGTSFPVAVCNDRSEAGLVVIAAQASVPEIRRVISAAAPHEARIQILTMSIEFSAVPVPIANHMTSIADLLITGPQRRAFKLGASASPATDAAPATPADDDEEDEE